MTVEINFIELKKKNITPLLLAIIFVSMLAVVGFLLFWHLDDLTNEQEALQAEIDRNMEKQAEIVNLQNIQGKRQQLLEQAETVEASIVPAVTLMEYIASLLPDGGFFESYSFSISDGILLDVRLETIEQVANYTHILLQQPFISNVDLASIDRQPIENGDYTASIQVRIDLETWLEVASDDR